VSQSSSNDLDASGLTSNSDLSSNTDDEDYEEDDDSWYFYIKNAIKNQAYNLSGFERLKTVPKKPK
jgi:hypothetical protein